MATKRSSKAASKSSKGKKHAVKRTAKILTFAAFQPDAEPEEYVAAKESLTEQLMPISGAETFSALSAVASPKPADNVVGVGIGEKVVGGKYTGLLALKILVRIKYSENQISPGDRLPESVNGLPTDVEEVGTFRRFQAAMPLTAPDPRARIRPAPPGSSVGFRDPSGLTVMAGTFGALARRGQRRFILSNNHVLADENRLAVGSPIFQPGLLDGGNANTDQVARLSAFVQLQPAAVNELDCAIAEADNLALVTDSILMIGVPRGTTLAQRDMVVHKFGRTTGYTVGRITMVNANARVNYHIGTLRFQRQIVIQGLNGQPFSDEGDSGSLILERSTGLAVGLLFGGSTANTLANHIGDVLQKLNVRLT